tara:strand:- start:1046 stop:1204 length:159 start_codon:yes stop_codon:yes gene_type:complete
MKKKPFWDRRLDICRDCEHKRDSYLGLKCAACGCFLEAKTRVLFMHCPREKW